VKAKLISGDEVDAIEGKRWNRFRPGTRKRIKRKISRRLRKMARLALKLEG
jgi:hypothetical protein